MGPGAGRHQGRAQAAGTASGGQGPPPAGSRQGLRGARTVIGAQEHRTWPVSSPRSCRIVPHGQEHRATGDRSVWPMREPCWSGTQPCSTLAVLPSPGVATAGPACAGSGTHSRVAGNDQIPAAGIVLGCSFPPPPPRAVPHPSTQQTQPPSCSMCFIQSWVTAGQC